MKPVLAIALVAAGLTFSSCSSGAKASEAIQRGDAYLKDGKVREAAIEFQTAVRSDERNGTARRKLGQTLARLGDLQRSMEQLVRAADLLPDPDVQLEATNALLAVGSFEDARTRAEAVLKADPKNVTAYVLRAAATAGMKDMDATMRSLQEAAKLEPNRSGTYIDLATVQKVQGNNAEAEAGFKQAALVAPTSAQPQLALAAFYWATGRRAETETALNQAVALEPNNAAANRALAGLYRGTGRAPLAESPLKRLADSSADPQAKLDLADYYIEQKRVADARPILTELARADGASAAAQSRLAAVEYEGGKRDEAYKILDGILAKEPTNADVMVVRGGWLLREGKLAEAKALGAKAAQTDPRSADAQSLLGSIAMLQNDPEAAVKALTEVARLRPNASSPQVALAGLLLAAGRTAEAGQFARQAVKLAPNVTGPRHALARVLYAEGHLNEAEQELQPVLSAVPNWADALGLRGLIREQRGDARGARQDFGRVLELAPGSVEALTGLARLDFSEKHPGDARKRLDAAVAKTPANPQLLLLAGRAKAATGDLAGAEASYQKALQADRSLVEAYDALGQLFVQQNKLEDARQAYERLTQVRPNDVAAHTMVARLLYLQGKPAESRARFEKILSVDPRAAVAANNLAYLDAEAAANLDVALTRAQTAVSVEPTNPEYNDTLGWVYVKRGAPALAQAPLGLAIEKDAANPTYHYHLGVAYAKAGEKDRARASLQKALQLSKKFDGAADAQRTLDSLGR